MKIIELYAHDVKVGSVGLAHPRCDGCKGPLNEWGDQHDVRDCLRTLADRIAELERKEAQP